MDAGRCRQCGRPFTSGEVTGVGILRPRQAVVGGPLVDFVCPACKAVNRLVPHGMGRYAAPGAPPPPEPTEEERRVPWRRGAQTRTESTNGAASPPESPRPATPASPAPVAAPPPPPPPPSPPTESAPGLALPVGVADALAALGLTAAASDAEIEESFRRLALTCHPDKVAHLDADFLALAERKFKRLQAARDLLVGD